MSALIHEEADRAVAQSASVGEITATMEELSRTSQQLSGNAISVKNDAAEAVGTARQGAEIGQESVDAMDQIRHSVEEITRKTVFLGDRSEEIGKVMGIIREISNEIQLLSLNAAIESAAAGEHGRRFSVVASEVRRLAERAKESAETINKIVSEIQAAISGSVETTRAGMQNMEMWRDTVLRSAEAFRSIISTIEKTSDASSQASMAVQQQTVAHTQVVRSMQEIANMVQETAAKMRESSNSMTELNRMTEVLEKDTLHFTV
jgi:methyl-accepting chemotaxis protein